MNIRHAWNNDELKVYFYMSERAENGEYIEQEVVLTRDTQEEFDRLLSDLAEIFIGAIEHSNRLAAAK